MKILLSFDIDGTLETGDPPGPVTLDMVRRAKERGCIIGSASDRSISTQKLMWEKSNIVVDFTSQKHVLINVRERFEADYYLHLGDRELDRQFALEAGFNFMWMTDAAAEPWLAMLNGRGPEPTVGRVPEGASDTAVLTAPEEATQLLDTSVPSEWVSSGIFSTADCRRSERDQTWCVTHNQPLWECTEYEADLKTPERKIKG
ncbi:MAG: HAD family hydrolase [Chloroflexi bacterium]|nr:HAD family hydrolase [Chloroflexota bacterium]